MLPDMAKDYNSAKSNTSTSVRKDEDEKGKLPAKAGAAGVAGAGIAGTGGADGGEAVAQSSSAGESSALLPVLDVLIMNLEKSVIKMRVF